MFNMVAALNCRYAIFCSLNLILDLVCFLLSDCHYKKPLDLFIRRLIYVLTCFLFLPLCLFKSFLFALINYIFILNIVFLTKKQDLIDSKVAKSMHIVPSHKGFSVPLIVNSKRTESYTTMDAKHYLITVIASVHVLRQRIIKVPATVEQ